MLGDAFLLLNSALNYAADTADRIFTAVGNAQGAILAMFVVYTSYRFFLKPILGGAGSDRVGRNNHNNRPYNYKVNEYSSSNSSDLTKV